MSSTWTKWQNLHAFCLCQDASSISLSLSQDHNNHCLVSVTKHLELWTSPQKKRYKPDLNRSLKDFVRTLSHVCIWQFVMFNGSRIWGNLDLFWTDRVGAAITACKQTHTYTLTLHRPLHFLMHKISWPSTFQPIWCIFFFICLYLNSSLRYVLYGPPTWLPDRLVHGEEYNTLKWRIVILELGVRWNRGRGHDRHIAQPTKFLVSSNKVP